MVRCCYFEHASWMMPLGACVRDEHGRMINSVREVGYMSIFSQKKDKVTCLFNSYLPFMTKQMVMELGSVLSCDASL